MKMSKMFKRFLKLMVAGLMGLLLFCVCPTTVAEASDMYFDDDGNLYFHTRDKKATSGTKYMTIGWVIKRYDMPMNAPGQQYVIVTKTTYKPDEVDPADSRYVFCYFRTDRDEILDAVKSVSEQWYSQLYYYGDEVYIDSVMTIVQSGKVRGQLYKGGSYTGEVYFTYEGIAGARKWASPQSLKPRFDMTLVFPPLQKPIGTSMTIDNVEKITIENANMLSFVWGAGQYGDETYDIGSGMPSGEDIYIKGMAANAIVNLTFQRIEGTYTTSMAFPVSYELHWTDYDGVERTEKKIFNRYYTVERKYSYYEYVDGEIYNIKNVTVNSGLLDDANYDIAVEDVDVELNIRRTACAYPEKKQALCGWGGVLYSSQKGVKPSIPDEDNSHMVEQLVGEMIVKNDEVKIGNTIIMSSMNSRREASAPKMPSDIAWADIYEDGINIPDIRPNDIYEDSVVKIIYESEEGQIKEYEYTSLPSISVHTPVYCDGTASEQAVIGDYMKIEINHLGQHRDILGYGRRDYSEFISRRILVCPFPVEYNGLRYEAGHLIYVDGQQAQLYICEDASPGEYDVTVHGWARNMSDTYTNYIERNANISTSNYGAWDVIPIKLVDQKEYTETIYQVSGTH
ncbi:MAG: hypothetical protein IJV71_11505 [Lachnospiraceae bacterium]|nr:hypothetical protein [Lachnospiraceae bacterium]